jgi:hypothetical protein
MLADLLFSIVVGVVLIALAVDFARTARMAERATTMKTRQCTSAKVTPWQMIAAEPIDYDFKRCILTELYAHPGSQVVKRNGHLFFQNGRFEFLCERLCEAKRR